MPCTEHYTKHNAHASDLIFATANRRKNSKPVASKRALKQLAASRSISTQSDWLKLDNEDTHS